MSVQRLPVVPSIPAFTFQTDLDGQTYGLSFEWNERVGAWFMDLADASGSPLISGVRVVADFPLCGQPTGDAYFPGILVAVDTSGDHIDPALDDLGARVQILYFAVTD